ncbi:MAG TPA: hypothetical protein VGE93_08250 [Bryobacteraceae bacterium]
MLPVPVFIAAQPSDKSAAELVALAPSPASVAVDAVPTATNKTSVSAPGRKATQPVESACPERNPRDIVVCGQRGQAYRVDPNVMDASRHVQANERSATSAVPAAQALCARPPVGPPPPCGQGLGSLDLANVAIVVGTTAVRAAKGEDWKSIFRPSGPDEYQLYKEAKRRREAADTERAAARLRMEAREAERKGQRAKQQF